MSEASKVFFIPNHPHLCRNVGFSRHPCETCSVFNKKASNLQCPGPRGGPTLLPTIPPQPFGPSLPPCSPWPASYHDHTFPGYLGKLQWVHYHELIEINFQNHPLRGWDCFRSLQFWRVVWHCVIIFRFKFSGYQKFPHTPAGLPAKAHQLATVL